MKHRGRNIFALVAALTVVGLSAERLFAQPVASVSPARLEFRSFVSGSVGTRSFYLYLPPGYDSTAERYPVVVLLRGVESEWITPNQDAARRGSIMTVADSLWRSGALPPVILVMPRIDSPPTWNDAAYIAGELLPWIDARYRTLPTRSRRAVDGFSYGGLGSAMLITHAPERFLSAGGYDGSLFLYDPASLQLWRPERRQLYAAMQFLYTTTGPGQTGNQSTNRAFVDTLAKYGIANGYAVLNLTPEAQHNWYYADLHAARALPRHTAWMDAAPQRLEVTANLPPADTTVHGIVTISWSIPTPPSGLRVFVLWSRDDGVRWHQVAESHAADSSVAWNTSGIADGTRYRLRLIAAGDTSYRDVRSGGSFTVDNPGNGTPDVTLEGPALPVLAGPVTLRWRARDPEGDPLTVAVSVSPDDGATWTLIDTGLAAVDSLVWMTADFPNSSRYRLRVQASDGQSSAMVTGPRFGVMNARVVAPHVVERLVGRSDVQIETWVAQQVPELSAGFRVVFHRTSGGIQYSILRSSTDSLLVPLTPLSFTGDESPLFDGKRIVISAVDSPQVWQDSTRWVVGSPALSGTVMLPTVEDGATTLRGVPTAEDYEIAVTAEPSDTSMEALGVPAQPVRFTVRTVGSVSQPGFIFVDADLSGGLSHGDELYLVNSAPPQPIQLGWAVQFAGPSGSAPLPGNVFRIRIRKPPEEGDTYVFFSAWNDVDELPAIPATIGLDPAYPNPFNATTTFRFRLGAFSRVTLEVVDLLGRRLETLVHDDRPAGEYRAVWNAGRFASGVYMIRLTAGTVSAVRRVVLIR